MNKAVVNLVNQGDFDPLRGILNGKFTLLNAHFALINDLTTVDFKRYLSTAFRDKKEVTTYREVIAYFTQRIKMALMTGGADESSNYVLEVVYWLAGYFQSLEKAKKEGLNARFEKM